MATFTAISNKTQNRTAMRKVLDYVMQDYKTVYNGQKLVSGQNCIPNSAYSEFMATKNQYNKANGVFFKQYVQSFKPNTATPELIHQIGRETAKYFEGFEVVVATHIDRDHWHNHFVVNSVNCETGLKIQINEKGLEDLRNYSDSICQKFGVETLKPYTKPKQKAMNTREYRAAMKGESWKFALMAMIDQAMKHCRTKDEFRQYMKRNGYDVKWQDNYKYITYTCPNNLKCRDIRLHEEKYRKENMELEFRLRGTQTKEQYEYQQTSASTEYNDNKSGTMADADRFEQRPIDTAGGYSRYTDNADLYGEFKESSDTGTDESNEFSEIENKRFRETGWESEREYLFNRKATEENGQSVGRTEKEMAADTDWSTDSNANPILDSLYTLASAAEIIRKPTTKTSRQAKNKKKSLGQREDDHSGDYQNNNKLYYGPSM
ncbi:MAG: relaxase/mobilization nuclease domain-containing protein [Acetobacter sp.]|nr:relaxase/mobilization nuclease domain-containing protein [Bacteroides sp.]MCM1341895.1 relaxase/mobilization nuclease domain-containing protein [Acetobacter sp.]MCM1433192.1 relaxase/mobilization nuclease domain-containing protein [Clostridiales bacterium]